MTAPQQEQQGSDLKALEAYIAYRTLVHGADQESVASGLALALYPLWAIQRFNELDRSTPLWLSAALPTVKTAYLQSQRLSAVYASDVRAATLAVEPPLPMVVPDVELPTNVPSARFDTSLIPTESTANQSVIHFDPFPSDDVATSLKIQGNYDIKASMPMEETEAMYDGLKGSSGASIRQAMNGGRNVTNNLVKFDRRIVGYARYTDSNPCYFCALLASLGAVFTKNSNKGGRSKGGGQRTKGDREFTLNANAPDLPDGYVPAKVHDHCKCTLRPVYSKAQSMDADANFYLDQWIDTTRKWYGYTNEQQVQEFRKTYKPFERPAPKIAEVRNELTARASALADAGIPLFAPQAQWVHQQLAQLA